MKKKKKRKKKIKKLPFSILVVGMISALVGITLMLSSIFGLISTYGPKYLQEPMFYTILGMGILLFALSYILLTGKYKLSRKELRERGKRHPKLTCKHCGRTPSLGIDYEGGTKTIYGNHCPYCGHRLY